MSRYQEYLDCARRTLSPKTFEANRHIILKWAYQSQVNDFRKENTDNGRLFHEMSPIEPNVEYSDKGAFVELMFLKMEHEEPARVKRIRAFFHLLKTRYPTLWKVTKAVIITKGNREEALQMLGMSEKFYLKCILRVSKLTI